METETSHLKRDHAEAVIRAALIRKHTVINNCKRAAYVISPRNPFKINKALLSRTHQNWSWPFQTFQGQYNMLINVTLVRGEGFKVKGLKVHLLPIVKLQSFFFSFL